MLTLRYYQRAAIDAVVKHIETKTSNPCVEIPTGGGKTPIIASLCKVLSESGYRVLVVAHRKELLEQTADKMRVWAPDVPVGLVSAGLDRREFGRAVTIGGIQSVYKKVNELTADGKIDFLIVDEAHLIPAKDEAEGGMYKTLIDDLKRVEPALTVVGLTATPYRLSSGAVCGPDNVLNEICYSVGVAELVGGGYLSKLVSKAPPSEIDFESIRIENGDFKRADVDERFNSDAIVHQAVSNILRYTKTRKSVLIFCASVAHAEAVAAELRKTAPAESVAVVTGATDKDERKKTLDRFQGKTTPADLLGNKPEPLKYLVNVDVLTTGFDAANVDCVVLLRPTLSPGLYYQMVGRGLRLFEGKENCLVLDFGGNMRRFGPIDAIEPPKQGGKRDRVGDASKTCPRCFGVVASDVAICDNCGFQFEEKKNDFLCPECETPQARGSNYCSNCGYKFPIVVKHGENADFDGAILTGEQASFDDPDRRPRFREKVERVDYLLHAKKDKPASIMVSYFTDGGTKINEFVCLSHTGYARKKAVEWWAKRSAVRPIPKGTEQALDIINAVGVAKPLAITYRPPLAIPSRKTYPELCGVELGEIPDSSDAPRTDNPVGLICPECEGIPVEKQSFRYLRSGSNFRVLCARCGTEIDLSTVPFGDSDPFFDNNIQFIDSENVDDFYNAFVN